MSNPLQILAGIVIVFFLPGWTFVNLLFPRKGELDPEYDSVYRLTLGMGLSIVIAIMVGFALNALSSENRGLVTAGPLWASLLSFTGICAVWGWYRGSYPSAGALHPALYRAPAIKGMRRMAKSNDYFRKRKTENLILERERLLGDMAVLDGRSKISNPQRSLYYRKRMDSSRLRIDQINEELRSLGSGGL